VLMTADELDAARWPGPPRHGDQVIYDDGTIAIIQGRADTRRMSGGDRVFTLTAIGG
jgi:hypothetical protein